uniref:Putative secreted carboxypeptidase n=1 Tax=Amblyomma americanum TaxID=6943 RepID=A0A0C9R6U3_AMBAM
MTAASLWSCVVLAGILQLASGSEQPNSSFTDSGPLFLTPFIKNCSFDEARNQSRVNLFQEKANVTAYSGYITVNETTGSNLFFLFIEAQNNSSEAPLMLWVQGGPGLSSLFGQFLQNGPIGINASGGLFHRNLTIQKDVNIIYLDVPVGAGFSFTRNKSGFARSLQDITVDIREFLSQFEKLFCEYSGRDFYVAGESYGARYAVSLAHSLKTNPSENITLKLQGTIGGVGFFGSMFQTADSSNFLYAASMLTKQGRNKFATQFEMMRQLASSGNTTQFQMAVGLLFQTLFNSIPPYPPTLFQNLTLYNSHASPL